MLEPTIKNIILTSEDERIIEVFKIKLLEMENLKNSKQNQSNWFVITNIHDTMPG